MFFVDRAELYVKGGDGGRGCLSFRREKFVPRGGPDGGDGGPGGDVVIYADPDADSLAGLSFRRHWLAENGQPGQSKKRTGRAGENLVIRVPPGTVIRDRDRGFVLKDLTEPHSQVVIARGGIGGRGNAAFATSTNQAPRHTQTGKPGEERWIILELKLIADVGLIGMPNAGKSTLLSRITKAQPEIADYPFTTKYPNLGVCRLGYDRTCGIADIPGLIEGAHEGVGLGHEFLRHVERTRLLVHLVEGHPMDGSDPIEHYHAIRNELQLYSPVLAEKPEIVALTKSDLGDNSELAQKLSQEIGRPVLSISSVTGAGMQDLMSAIAQGLNELDAAEKAVQRKAKPKVVPPHLRNLAESTSENSPAPNDDASHDA